MSDIKVSIIIPIYNVEPYIADCLQSVMNQTMTEGVECILVDDCGQDNSMQVAEQMIADYQGNIHFSIFHHEHNKGLSGARNSGIRAAKGEYVYFLDSDDTITTDCIESMWAMVGRFPNVDCVFAGANVEHEKYSFMDYTKKRLHEYSCNRHWLSKTLLERYTLSMTAWNRLYKKSFIEDNSLYFEEGFNNEDEILNLRLSACISSAAFKHANTYNYRYRENSIVNQKERDISKDLKILNKLIDSISGYNINNQVKTAHIYISEKINGGYIDSFNRQVSHLIFRLANKCHTKYRFYLYLLSILCLFENHGDAQRQIGKLIKYFHKI